MYTTADLPGTFFNLFSGCSLSETMRQPPFIICMDFRFTEELLDTDLFPLGDNKINQDSWILSLRGACSSECGYQAGCKADKTLQWLKQAKSQTSGETKEDFTEKYQQDHWMYFTKSVWTLGYCSDKKHITKCLRSLSPPNSDKNSGTEQALVSSTPYG